MLEARARRSLSTTPRPFLKWAGSKRALVHHLVDLIPPSFGTYWEPFLGAGSLFFLLQPERAHLNDSLAPLIRTYSALRDRADLVVRYLVPLKVDRAEYYRVRANRGSSDARFAAEFIYLNKTGWNGLYRVNSRGEFNVPFGAPSGEPIVDRENLLACSSALAKPHIRLSTGDFEAALARVSRGDLVFLDPPYVTGHNNNGFVDYNEVLFSWDDQHRLAKRAAELADLGATVIVTNAMHDEILALYPGFNQRRISRASTLASDKTKRRRVDEVVLWRTPSDGGAGG